HTVQGNDYLGLGQGLRIGSGVGVGCGVYHNTHDCIPGGRCFNGTGAEFHQVAILDLLANANGEGPVLRVRRPNKPVGEAKGHARSLLLISAICGGLYAGPLRTCPASPPASWPRIPWGPAPTGRQIQDRKSTRLNSSHVKSSYAVSC